VADLAPSITPADDATILLQAEGIVRDFCGWVIAPPETVTVVVESRGGCTLLLPSAFVTDVVSVTVVDGAELTGYRLTGAGILADIHFPCGPIEVEFTHGYAADEVPPAVTRVVQAVAQRIKGRAALGGLKSRQVGPFMESYGVELDNAERAMLAPYSQLLV
jgi:hypothetical protein